MRTVEAALGLLIIAAALALSLGAARLIAPVPPTGLGLTLALSGWGATLAAHGMTGRALRKQDRATAYSWRAVFYLLLALTLAATMPLVVDLLNLGTVAGFPVGFYVAAQGLLIVMAILAFRAATHLDALSSATASAQPRKDN
jgi:putative solute:sodium symporter small subunit